jgi:5-methyltetrahydrofolate--homocysteine methyltransferase
MQPLVLDMMERPEPVKAAVVRLSETWTEVHEELYQMAAPANDDGCCIAWMQSWAPGRHYQMSCDFSAVLSPRLFDEFIVPEIRTYLEVNEYSVYHWDGPDAVKFLDSLLAIEELDAIQWTQGAGSPPASDPRWIPLYRKIQAAGKRLILPFVEVAEVEGLLAQISSRGLLIGTAASSEDEARDLLRKVPGWTRD